MRGDEDIEYRCNPGHRLTGYFPGLPALCSDLICKFNSLAMEAAGIEANQQALASVPGRKNVRQKDKLYQKADYQ